MRRVAKGIAAVGAIGALMAANGLGMGVKPQVGEAVPDEVAAAQTGGCPTWACGQIQQINCRTIAGTNCVRTLVHASDTQGSRWNPPTCSVWCGQGGSNSCLEYPPPGNVTSCSPPG